LPISLNFGFPLMIEDEDLRETFTLTLGLR
jgi:hypothetical protein